MRFCILGSGSSGNAAVIQCGDTVILLDCGFSARETVARLSAHGLAVDQVSAIVLTHEHADHANGVRACARRLNAPVWMTRGSHQALGQAAPPPEAVRFFTPHEPFAIGAIELEPFPVPHDAREPAQFVFSSGAVRLGFLTDIGTTTAHVEARLQGCDALVLECNHDRDMLEDGDYPAALKARIRSEHGHLDNETAARILRRLDHGRLQHVVAAHLSRKNNRPELARAALGDALGCDSDDVAVADQDTGLAWRELVNGSS